MKTAEIHEILETLTLSNLALSIDKLIDFMSQYTSKAAGSYYVESGQKNS